MITLILAMVVRGAACAVQDTLLKAIVAGVLPEGKRNLAFRPLLHFLRSWLARRQYRDGTFVFVLASNTHGICGCGAAVVASIFYRSIIDVNGILKSVPRDYRSRDIPPHGCSGFLFLSRAHRQACGANC